MTGSDDGTTDNTISGGTQFGPVLQGKNFRDIHIENVVQAAPAPVARAQLPPLEAGFTGRGQEIAEIISLLSAASDAGAVVVSAVAGLAGVGKTALAVQAAHTARQAGWFPVGCCSLICMATTLRQCSQARRSTRCSVPSASPASMSPRVSRSGPVSIGPRSPRSPIQC